MVGANFLNASQAMNHFPFKLNLQLCKKGNIFYHSKKEDLKIGETAKFGGEILQNNRDTRVKFGNFVHFCITHGKALPFPVNFGYFVRNTKIQKTCRLLKQIFSIFYNISPPNPAVSPILRMLFLAVRTISVFLPR